MDKMWEEDTSKSHQVESKSFKDTAESKWLRMLLS